MLKEKKNYQKPDLKVWGDIADLTKTGSNADPSDNKGGSVLHSNDPNTS